MQIIRTLIWIAIASALVAFLAMNWFPNTANVYLFPVEQRTPQEPGYFYVTWPAGVIVLVSFLLGIVPMWLYHRADKWRWNRRIAALENSMRATAQLPPLATSTQFEAEQQKSPEHQKAEEPYA